MAVIRGSQMLDVSIVVEETSLVGEGIQDRVDNEGGQEGMKRGGAKANGRAHLRP
jgi:hypothetical protein